MLLAGVVICGMLGYKMATKSTGRDTKGEELYEKPPARFGVVTAILYCDDDPTVLIEDEVLHEGETIHDVKIVDISRDKVKFEKFEEQWEQKVQEPARPEWWKRKAKGDSA